MDEIAYRILGSVEVLRGGRVLPVRAPRQRALLAVLLLEANRVVSAERLAAQLWGEAPPAQARNTIQTLVLRLRRLLTSASCGDVLITERPGYLLRVGPGQLDLQRFQDLLATGRAALSAGQTVQASEALHAALELWRGEPLADVADIGLLGIEARRLREQRMQAVEARIEVDLRLGRYDTLAAELPALIAGYPSRERLHGQLMLALYRAGRRAEALAVFDVLRRRLVDDLGVEPGPELLGLRQAILRDDLDPPAPALAPGSEAPAASVPASPVLSLCVPAQLPLDVPAFAGRRHELARLDAALATAGGHPTALLISALSGTAGVGKTALAVHWAHRVRHRFPDGQLYVNLRGFDPVGPAMSPSEAVRGFLDAFEIPARHIPADLDGQAALYRSVLTGKRVLVLLDNARDDEQVRPLLPGSPGCLAVVTSRNQLSGLVVAAGADPLELDLMSFVEARELLVGRLGAARVAAEPQVTDEIIAGCARLPLALALVAARAATHPSFPLVTLAAELRDSAGGLNTLSGDDALTDLRTVFSWSYQALDAGAARLFRLLGLHPGPDFAAAAAASLAGTPVGPVRRLLADLAQAHLITEHTPGRYAFHDLLRAYASELSQGHDVAAERQAAVRRMLDYYLHTAHAADRRLYPNREAVDLSVPVPGAVPDRFAEPNDALAWFAAEYRVLLAAIRQADGSGLAYDTWQLAWTVTEFINRRGDWPDLAAIQGAALDAARRLGDRAGQAYAWRALARAHDRLGRYDDASRHLRHALELYTELGDRTGQAYVHLRLGFVSGQQQRHQEALAYGEHALALFLATGDPAGQAHALNAIGWLRAQIGDHDQAVTCCQQALALQEKTGDQLGQAITWDSLGYAYHHLGHHGEARSCYEQALDLYRQRGDRYGEAETLAHLGDAHDAAGDSPAAHRAWQLALDTLLELGHPDVEQVRAKLNSQRTTHGGD